MLLRAQGIVEFQGRESAWMGCWLEVALLAEVQPALAGVQAVKCKLALL